MLGALRHGGAPSQTPACYANHSVGRQASVFLNGRQVVATAQATVRGKVGQAAPVQAMQQQPPSQPMPGPGPQTGRPGMAQPQPESSQMALVRRPYYPVARAQPVFLYSSQVTGKQVITRSTGKSLGVVGAFWVDVKRYEVVSLDLEEKKTMGTAKYGNMPLNSLYQIGDVVLVEDESVLYEQQLDGRFGFVNLLGLEVRTRSGVFLGKVRDFSFSPDNGQLNRIVYDDFGLNFLPISFFDCFSLPIDAIESVGFGGIIVSSEARSMESKDSEGILGAVPAILRSIQTRPAQLALPEGYRKETALLPPGYTTEQWQADIRMWEAQTGMTYEEYMRQQQSGGMRSLNNGVRAALPSRSSAQSAPAQRYGAQQPAAPQGYPPQQQSYQGYGAPPGPARPQQQQQYGGPGTPGMQVDPRYRGNASGGPAGPRGMPADRTGMQPQQQRGAPMAPQQPAQQAASPAGWPQQPQQQQQQGGYQAQQPQQAAAGRQAAGPAGPRGAGGPGGPAGSGGNNSRRVDEWIVREQPRQPVESELAYPGGDAAGPAAAAMGAARWPGAINGGSGGADAGWDSYSQMLQQQGQMPGGSSQS